MPRASCEPTRDLQADKGRFAGQLLLASKFGSIDYPRADDACSAIYPKRTRSLPGRELPSPATGVSMSKINVSTPVEFKIPPTSEYLLVARMSNRSEVRYDIGRGCQCGEVRFGHMLLHSALDRSWWWLSRPEQTIILSVPVQMFQHAWENDTGESWPGMMRMHSFRQDSLVIQLLAGLAGELDRPSPVNRVYTNSLMFQLSTHLVRRYSDSIDLSIRHCGMPPSRLKKVVEFVTESLEEEIGLAEMAQVAGISPYYFCREFKKTMGITPHQYVVQQRIDRAKVLLQNSSMSITEIGAELQFPTPSHFTATFRKMVGMTPSAFRPHS